MFVTIQGFGRVLSSEEILKIIPKETLAKLKAKEEHPYFQAYSICHEGISRPKVLGDTSKPIHWLKKAIQSIKNVITKGIKLFRGHNKDNSTEGRRELGEVVGDTQIEIEGKLHHVIVAHHPQGVVQEVKGLDVCSQEANWNLIDLGKELLAETMDKLTGIALASSKEETPAFEGAKRLGMVQAFENNDPNGQKTIEPGKGDTKNMVTFKEIEEGIRELRIFPSQLFTVDDLKKDNIFIPILKKVEDLEAENKKIKEDLETAKNDTLELRKTTAAKTAKDRLNEKVKVMTLTEKQKAFIDKRFKPESMEDLSDEALSEFLDNQLADYKEMATVFTNEEEAPGGDTGITKKIDPDDIGKTENNEYLEEDID